MNFLKTVSDSIYSPPFYAAIPKKSWGEALKYFFLLSFLLALVQSALPAWNFLSVAKPEIDALGNRARAVYPPELELRVQNGTVTTNVQEPYVIPLPISDELSDQVSLAVIDTRTPFSAGQFNDYNTIAWIAKDAIFVQGDDQIRTIDLSETADFTIDKTMVDSWITTIVPWLSVITPLALTGIFLMMFALHTMRLVYLLFFALLIWVLMKLIKKPLTYSGSYKMGLYAMTLGFFAELAFSWVNFSGFSFLFTLITLGVIAGNFASLSQKSHQG